MEVQARPSPPLSARGLAPDAQGLLGLGATEEAPGLWFSGLSTFPGFGQMTSPWLKLSSAGFGTAMQSSGSR
ncbi:hypothetical protein TgHK011_000208 [Trichoderma gracile]|nr:hypothetical protein TgHK011_000208 [Trichoderma gracile]